MQQNRPFQLRLMGSFQLTSPDGERVRISSKKGRALLALLVMVRGGERTRAWLQDRLWGSRGIEQAQASLRRELANLRTALAAADGENLLDGDAVHIRIDLQRVGVDARALETVQGLDSLDGGEFLEGFDIAEEGFEDWLREQRFRIETLKAQLRMPSATSAHTFPNSVADDTLVGGRPTISVLSSVENVSNDDGVFLEGITDMLIERIARLRWLAVIAAPAGWARPIDPNAVRSMSERLGAAYLLHSRLAATGPDKQREVHLVLSEGASGRLLWSRRYRVDRLFEGGSLVRIAEETVAALAARIEVEQQKQVLDRGIQKLNPNELVWRARWHMRRLTKNDAKIAGQLLDQATAESPNDPDILIEQGVLAAWRIWTSRGGRDEKTMLRAMAMRARHADPFDARAYLLCGIAEMWLGNLDNAKAMLLDAIELNPSMANAYGQIGSCFALAGEPGKAIPMLETALRLNPLDTESFHQYGELALAKFMLGRHRDAVHDADRSLARRPAYFYAHVLKIAALTELGECEDEMLARRIFETAKPGFAAEALEWLPFKDRRWVARLQAALDPPALRLAG